MKRKILALFCVLCVVGLAQWAGAVMVDGEKYDTFDPIDLRARVLEVAADCSWVVVGETRFETGSLTLKGKRLETTYYDADGNPLKNACSIRPRDRVYAKGVILNDGTIMAVTIRKSKL